MPPWLSSPVRGSVSALRRADSSSRWRALLQVHLRHVGAAEQHRAGGAVVVTICQLLARISPLGVLHAGGEGVHLLVLQLAGHVVYAHLADDRLLVLGHDERARVLDKGALIFVADGGEARRLQRVAVYHHIAVIMYVEQDEVVAAVVHIHIYYTVQQVFVVALADKYVRVELPAGLPVQRRVYGEPVGAAALEVGDLQGEAVLAVGRGGQQRRAREALLQPLAPLGRDYPAIALQICAPIHLRLHGLRVVPALQYEDGVPRRVHAQNGIETPAEGGREARQGLPLAGGRGIQFSHFIPTRTRRPPAAGEKLPGEAAWEPHRRTDGGGGIACAEAGRARRIQRGFPHIASCRCSALSI